MSRIVRAVLLPIAVICLLAGCEQAGEGRAQGRPPAQTIVREATATPPAAETPAGPLVAAGPATSLSADGDDNLQWAASVVRLVPIEDQNAKIFGTAGGDPAVNGLYTYVAFFLGSAEGWQVYRLGDFETFTVMAVTPGRIDLGITESTVSQTSGAIVSETRRAIVRWTPGVDGAAPTGVTLAPAR